MRLSRAFFVLFAFLYLFGVSLRIVGLLLNGESIKDNLKATLLLGELDGTELAMNTRWYSRIGVMAGVSLLFAWLIKSKKVRI